MDKPSFTPGPLTWLEADDWREAAERGQCFTLADADSNDIADIYHNNHATVPTTPDQAAAYARLFAAAPLMAAALGAYVKAQSRMLEKWADGDNRVKTDLWRDLHACEEAARAALSSARGETV